MPTWKHAGDGAGPRYLFLCSSCNDKRSTGLAAAGWTMTRSGEPASCNECVLRCQLSTQALWDADEATRYAVCAQCPDYDGCFYKGRHYC
jgi:hypothetical protein